MKISASLIKTWMDCAKKAHFQEILEVKEQTHAKTVFGSCVHEALELYNTTGDIEMAVVHFKDLWEDPSLIDAEIDIWPSYTSWQELKERGVLALRTFHESSQWETRNIIASEHKFRVPFGDHILSGIVDNLELTSKELRVIDYKTSSRLPTQLQLRFDVQFTIYVYATLQPEFWIDIEDGEKLYEKLKDMPRRGVWYSIWHNKMLDAGGRDELDYERLYRVLLEIEQAIDKDVYVPNISGDSCIWCPYTRVCAATIPLAEEVDLARSERT